MKFFYYKVYHLDRAEVSSLWLTSQINVVVFCVCFLLLLFLFCFFLFFFVVVFLPHCLDRSISALHYVFMDLPLVVLQLTPI